MKDLAICVSIDALNTKRPYFLLYRESLETLKPVEMKLEFCV
jgi:hypothetical protein